ncbi:prolactin-releasing peptide receptor-like isoform X1 [Haliotis rufescens]|uniref:prolactin-releasing peptide receptor-like isoform X1 n=1 Tax=Haliotis rufescens TaxID=6454 RepID=UPI001EAF9EBD|nr:prolactin-releasing peptide receptor-like isoform X1 [Haliotis rufescens]XP_046368331.1 prolactin-releasing peptide receptor-like isoform X1 [Haliotis rufescens]XP_046368332.1 prolactin-releasing peptide receptor-like isoform X1 [Haliotis rufescens]
MALAESRETYIELILRWLIDNNSTEAVDFTQPYVRRSLRYVYPLFMFLHAVVGVVGIVGNIIMLIVLGKRKLYHDQTFFLLGNLAFADLIKCIFVLPITLANLLIQNWLLGSFLCFFLPMMQCFPVYASMMTFLMIAIDRYRTIVHPFKSRLPAGLCTIAVWVVAVCVVLPFAVYIKYIDLGASLGARFNGVGICYVYFERRIEEYIRAMFVTLYAMPLAIIAFLYVRVSAEIKSRESASISIHFASNGSDVLRNIPDHSYQSSLAWPRENRATTSTSEVGATAEPTPPQVKSYNERATQDSDDDLDLVKEKRTQNYLISMTTLFAMCWCPLHILILVHYFVHENDTNQDHYDVTYITFTWFGFLSTCTNPILFASWSMSSATKDRLRGYFRFSNRRRSASSQRRRYQTHPHYVNGATCTTFEERIGLDNQAGGDKNDEVEAAAV